MKLTIGAKMYMIVLTMFIANTIIFLLFQHNRERQYKIETLDTKLADFNDGVYKSMEDATDTANAIKFIKAQNTEKLRLTIMEGDGTVLYDSDVKRYDTLATHAQRTEVKKALKTGHGYDINRLSKTTKQDYFYSATYYKDKDIVVRTACPYNVDLIQMLKTDRGYIWIAISTLLILTLLLCPITYKIGKNIKNLKEFAKKADSGEAVKTEDIAQFPGDEMGEISEHIVKLYIKLQNTRREQDQLKRELTQNVAHELKTPVAGIKGYLETIVTQYDNIDEKTKKHFIEKCYGQSERLSNLVMDISTLNRLDDGKDQITFENVDLASVIRNIVAESEMAMKENDMTCEDELPEKLYTEGSHAMLYSIFRNLMDNAIAYAGAGTRVKIAATKTSDTNEKGEGKYEFTFEDNGNGVEPEHLSRLFERFYRVDKGRSRKMGGTGLGLAIVKNAVLLHGGSITAENVEGGGLRFRFTLKCSEA